MFVCIKSIIVTDLSFTTLRAKSATPCLVHFQRRVLRLLELLGHPGGAFLLHLVGIFDLTTLVKEYPCLADLPGSPFIIVYHLGDLGDPLGYGSFMKF